jgi:carboxyl-terminal processing protease
MRFKRTFGPRIFAAAVSLLLMAPAVMAEAELTKEKKELVLKEMSRYITETAFVPGVDFTKWDEYLAKSKESIDAAKTDEEFGRAVNGALNEFKFSHIVLMTPRVATVRRENRTVGIGVTVQLTPDGLLIYRVVEGGPAKEAGLEPGDIIVEHNGKKPEAPTDLLGEEGQKLTFKVKRGDGSIKEYTMTRRKFSTLRPEALTWETPDTARIAIHTFDLSYDGKRVESLMKQAGKAKNLIVDLRGNGGGAVINLLHFLGLVMPDQAPIGTFVSKRLVRRFEEEQKGDKNDLAAIAKWAPDKLRATKNERVARFKGNVAVLINGGSGSASEIAAAALRETMGATVVGSQSAGAVLVSIMAPLKDTGYLLQFPLSDYVTPGGLRLEGNGVKPDAEARFEKAGVKDEVVAKALALLTKSAKAGIGSGG